ncbi:MAG: GatB/YqeY domain-containing protein, partial [Patescibacteria group bacterium]
LQLQVSEALKSGDRVRVETLRFLLSAVRNAAIAKYGNKSEVAVTDDDVVDVIKKQVKTHRESVEAFTQAGRQELADAEKAQLAILESYLPKQMSDDDLKKLLGPIAASGEKNYGLLMGQAMKAVKGQADGARVSTLLKEMIQQ